MKKKLLKIGIILFGIGLLSAFGVYMYVFHKPHRNVEAEKPAFIINASDLFNEYSTNEEGGKTKFQNKVLQVTGSIAEVTIGEDEATIVLVDATSGISCAMDSLVAVQMKDKIKTLKVGENITLKGKCDGFDAIMGVVLTKCYFIDN